MNSNLLTKFALAALASLSLTNFAHADRPCELSMRQDVCIKMRNLRAGINALDAQRELMQVNPTYLEAIGWTLRSTANSIRPILGPGIPEHQQGLAGVAKLGGELAMQASEHDITMLKTANQIRNQCATCHATAHPPGGVDWNRLFDADWNSIANHCNTEAENPYLCRSMNGMLSAYAYLVTAKAANSLDFAMTEQAASEVVRILRDLKAKNFKHLPEDLRSRAEADAQAVVDLAKAEDPSAFDKAVAITTACTQCHNQTGGGGNTNISPVSFRWMSKR